MATVKRRAMVTVDAGVADDLRNMAVSFYVENNLANEHGTKAKNLRKTLFADMLASKVKKFTARFTSKAGEVDLNVEIGPGRNTSEVDMKALRKIVADDMKLLSLCSMTKTDVVTHFGTAIADQVCKVVPGSENVQVSVVK
jgi:hypothetical protein